MWVHRAAEIHPIRARVRGVPTVQKLATVVVGFSKTLHFGTHQFEERETNSAFTNRDTVRLFRGNGGLSFAFGMTISADPD